ncbi:uncharacterized protein BYT42DRAFT_547871 [Radiomyces spectabilis]|uniref:uncharacterized protein n=1 Tax=Radiomyces spectabilis TaxID=64574 RepID=UPI00221F44D9|nr:uncharacterized protein BYT42DRAFT_547871 [Radiomyces spectabilis]KAI8372827.1 hypothetical protein BYT42DRAFT_547871 [Radiomyces spectabilis]
MDNCKAFHDRDIVAICDYLVRYCRQHINGTPTISRQHAFAFYSFLPTLLVYIFGSPTQRGWIQTDTQPKQDESIRQLLSYEGDFLVALRTLSKDPDYTYEVISESIPNDVRRILTTGALQHLPRLYANCIKFVRNVSSNATDVRAAATRRSNIPASSAGEYKVKLNMYQFYLYYLVSVPTWPPLMPPPTTVPTPASAPRPLSTTLPSNTPFKSPLTYTSNTTIAPITAYPTAASHIPSLAKPPMPISKATNTSPSFLSSASKPATTTTNLPYQAPGRLRSIAKSCYYSLIENYMHAFIPSVVMPYAKCSSDIGSFFLDACVELWLRAAWVSPNQSLPREYMDCISLFVAYVVKGDLRRCTGRQPADTEYAMVYDTVREELYYLLSRLMLNWRRHDDFYQVMNLWYLWAAPWRLGSIKVSTDTAAESVMDRGWTDFVLENALFYFPPVDILLRRASTFNYVEKMRTENQVMAPANPLDPQSIAGHLRTVFKLVEVLATPQLMDVLEHIEAKLIKIHSETTGPLAKRQFNVHTLQIDELTKSEGVSYEEAAVWILCKQLVQLEDKPWEPIYLYVTNNARRAESLVKALEEMRRGIYFVRNTLKSPATKFQPAKPLLAKTTKNVKDLELALGRLQALFKTNETTPKSAIRSTIANALSGKKPSQRAGPSVYLLAGLSNGGFLTAEEREGVKNGKMRCTHASIPALGPRARYIVRSYESVTLVRWTLAIDGWLNHYYHRWVSPDSKYFPGSLTVRPLAAKVNMFYLISFWILSLLVLYIALWS